LTSSPGRIHPCCLAAPVPRFPAVRQLLFLAGLALRSAELVTVESLRRIIKKNTKRLEEEEEGGKTGLLCLVQFISLVV